MRKAPYVRLVREDELKFVAAMNQRAFIVDPIQNFFAGLPEAMTFEDRHKSKRKNQENFFIFMLRASVRSGARITVVVVPEGDSERIVACTLWRPPHKDVPLSNIVFLVRCGIVQVLLGWGFSLFKRISAVVQPTDATLVEGYKEMGLEGTPEDSWYLQLAGTDPEFQNKGFMGMLMREAFKHTPSAEFTLEASTPESRDKYEHFGFKLVKEVTIGGGLVDTRGFAISDAALRKGFAIYPMIKKGERTVDVA